MSYLEKNLAYWQQGYRAENVESWVFRPYGRILKPLYGLNGPGQSMLDWGCGQGAALSFYAAQGFDVYGVDISEVDVARAKERVPNGRIAVIDPAPTKAPYFPGVAFDLVVSVQSFYYLNDADMEACLLSLRDQMKPGAVMYATMISERCWYFERSVPAADGMRVVNIDGRLTLRNHHINFTRDRAHLIERFGMFEPLHVGYYDACWLEDEPSEHHFTFIGRA